MRPAFTFARQPILTMIPSRMAYIESELKARRDKALSEGKDAPAALQGAEALASLDPRDELYRIAEKYRVDKNPVIEGNVTLSAAMLTAIPEVDLGIECVLPHTIHPAGC